MEINRNNVLEIINKSGLKPDKDYGQNFLVDPIISKRIVDQLELKNDDSVLEIGPGIGSLTHFLSQNNSASIDLVDIDQRMVDFLRILYSNPNIDIVLSDIRKHDVSKYNKILGNLPYNITTETIVYLLERASKADKMVLMCQSEAFDHFNDLTGKEYGPSSILLHLVSSIKRCFNVKPGSFYPPPKCTSTVFVIDFKQGVDRELSVEVYRFSKKLFLNRRKTIYNNLSSLLGDKEKAESILNASRIPLTKRPEELSPETFVELYKAINNL